VEFVPVPEPCRAAQAKLIEQVAQKIHRYGLEVPAIFFGEAMKPASFALGQAMHAFSFLPEAYFGREDLWQQLGFMLDDRSQVEKLLVRLEELAKSR